MFFNKSLSFLLFSFFSLFSVISFIFSFSFFSKKNKIKIILGFQTDEGIIIDLANKETKEAILFVDSEDYIFNLNTGKEEEVAHLRLKQQLLETTGWKTALKRISSENVS